MDNEQYFEKLKDLSSFFFQIQAIALKAENLSGKFPLNLANEMRNSLEHLMRSLKSDCMGPIEEIDKAKAHLRRVGFDSYNVMSTIFLEKLEAYDSKYSPAILDKAEPTYFSEILPAIERIRGALAEARASKDTHSSKNVDEIYNKFKLNNDILEKYTNDMDQKWRIIADRYLKSEDGEKEQAQKDRRAEKKRTNLHNWIIGIVASVIGAIAGTVLTKAFS